MNIKQNYGQCSKAYLKVKGVENKENKKFKKEEEEIMVKWEKLYNTKKAIFKQNSNLPKTKILQGIHLFFVFVTTRWFD